MAPHPGIDTSAIKDKARKDLLDLLEGVRGKKNLVIEKALAGPIGLLVTFSVLQEYGVDKVFFLENDNVDVSQKNVIFLIRGENAARSIAVTRQIKRLQKNSSSEHEFSVFLIPRRTLVCNKILEDEGVLGDVSVEELPIYFIPLADDVLSLELVDSFGDLYLRKDPTCTFLTAQALMLLQQGHGLFPRILGKGDNGRRLMELLIRLRAEATAEDSTGVGKLGMMPSGSIENLIIIDREVDFGTVLLTQLTYEGLIEEKFGIKDNQAEVDVSIVGPGPGQQASQAQSGLKRKIQLDSSDKLFDQLRDSHFAVVGNILRKAVRGLETIYENRHQLPKSTAELKDLVSKLPGYQANQQALKVHTGLAEEIQKYTQSDSFIRTLEVQQNFAAGTDPSVHHDTIEELIARNSPLSVILRLLCLESCVSGGIRAKDLENFKRLILHAYGYQHLLTFDALERMHLLEARTSANVLALPGSAPAGTKTNYNYLRKVLRLIVDEVNEQEPDDIAYVYSGYAPLSIRIVQCVLQKQYLLNLTKGVTAAASQNNGVNTTSHGWHGFEDAMKSIKGDTFNKVQKGEEAATKARQILSGQGGKKTIIVMFLGGVTYTEIAALRFIAKQEEAKRRILICTTGIVSGNRMIDVAVEKGDLSKVPS
ncbi:hypothetical protein MMC25_004592 [Agyrium rufum]|nr:hypothetical protein [Agyrium rufum]